MDQTLERRAARRLAALRSHRVFWWSVGVLTVLIALAGVGVYLGYGVYTGPALVVFGLLLARVWLLEFEAWGCWRAE